MDLAPPRAAAVELCWFENERKAEVEDRFGNRVLRSVRRLPGFAPLRRFAEWRDFRQLRAPGRLLYTRGTLVQGRSRGGACSGG